MQVEIAIKRRDLMQSIRSFFSSRDCLEVEVPLMGRGAGVDPHLDLFETRWEGKEQERFFFHSSPEFFLKRLLARGYPDLFYLGPTFRNGELGSKHLPQFTILEWYRKGVTIFELMEEVIVFIESLRGRKFDGFEVLSYEQVFEKFLGIHPSESMRKILLASKENSWGLSKEWSKQDCLDYLLSVYIEPRLGKEKPLFVYPYPEDQAALAKKSTGENGLKVAHRFELYLNGWELTNGYWELADREEQEKRFLADQEIRRQLGKDTYQIDKNFLKEVGDLPDCCGVALGVDRLFMWLLEIKDISEVTTFPFAEW